MTAFLHAYPYIISSYIEKSCDVPVGPYLLVLPPPPHPPNFTHESCHFYQISAKSLFIYRVLGSES